MNYCNCPNCRTDNCPAGVEYGTLKRENLRLKANHILATNALEDPKDLFVVLRKEEHQAMVAASESDRKAMIILREAVDRANKLIESQANENDDLVAGLNRRIKELESEVRFLERHKDESGRST